MALGLLAAASGVARADQCAAIDAAQAEAAAVYVHVGDTVGSYCEPCGDTAPEAVIVESVSVEAAEGHSQLYIDGAGVDLAYTYVYNEDTWDNLALLAQCPAEDVLPVLSAMQ